MAKINARGARQVGPTFYTDRILRDGKRVLQADTHEGRMAQVEEFPDLALYRQAWRLRSDGSVLERIVWVQHDPRGYTSRATKHPGRSIHTSTWAIRGKFDVTATMANPENLRSFLARNGYAIVEEK